ncbi:MarR family winged helix-turn-helix transcriptional regulator [Faecalimicrobium sp. JNUCC 81]
MVSTLGSYISILNRQKKIYVNSIFKHYGLGYSSCVFLIFISTNEGINQKELCKRLVIDEAHATRTVRDLEKQGMILKRKDPEKPRSNTLYITEKGWELVPKLKEVFYNWWLSITDNIDEQQVEWLVSQVQYMSEKAREINRINCSKDEKGDE